MSIHTKATGSPEVEKKAALPLEDLREKKGVPAESQLVSFGDRITYVFAYGKEVGSIHFDRSRGEIFYKGHNIRNMDSEEWQMQVMETLRQILETDEKGRGFAEAYGRTLDKIVLEKRNPRKL